MGIRLKLTPAQKLARAKAAQKRSRDKKHGMLDRSPLTKKEQADFVGAKRRGKGNFTPTEIRKMKREQERLLRLKRERAKEDILIKGRKKKQKSTRGYA